MHTILCPTRGGERSYPNQDWAIALAKERGADLIFLYINDVKFLKQASTPALFDLANDLDEMGEFLLSMAKERADQAGVKAQTQVRRGVFEEVLRTAIPEFEVKTLVLGSSDDDKGHTSNKYLLEFSASLAEELGVEVVVLKEGQVLETIPA
jgi:nucleotide-binding universal stress UspA family protein